jgi:hypothetical protein
MGLDVMLYRGAHPGKKQDGEEREVRCLGNAHKRYRIEEPSAKYPEHMFKLGYFRSSYNEGGINSVLEQYNIPGLYEIFEVDFREHEYGIKPNWTAALRLTQRALTMYDAAKEAMQYKIVRCRGSHDVLPTIEAAMTAYMEERAKTHDSDFISEGYSNGRGDFWHKGITIYGVMTGQNLLAGTPFAQALKVRPEDTLLVIKNESAEWYRQALEIVEETCEWVLAQKDPKDFHLHWSA